MVRKILGIDLESHELKLAEWNGDSVSFLYRTDTPENLIDEGHIISYEAAADFIKDTLKAANIRTKDACLVLPDSELFMRRVTVPFMDDKKLLVNLPYEFHDYLSEDKSKYYYDYTVNETVYDEEGNPVELDITAGAVLKEQISLYRAMLRRAGLKLIYAIPTELAFSNLISKNEDVSGKELCFLDVRHAGSRLDIFTGTKYETTKLMENGIRSIDEAIAEINNIDEHMAHEYVQNDLDDAAQGAAAVSVYSSIATDTRRAINFFSLNNRESNLEDMYLCGAGSHISPLTAVLTENVGVRIHPVAELFPDISCEGEDVGAYAVAIGAAIHGKGMNLAKSEKNPLRPSLIVPLILAVLALVALVGKFTVYDRYEKLFEAQSTLEELQSFNSLLEKETSDYDNVYSEYLMYSTKWMTENEQVLVTRENMLKLVEKELMGKGRILNFSSGNNMMTVDLAGVTLDDTSKLLSALNARDDVLSASVSNAKADAVTYETSSVDEDGVEVIETKTESLVTLAITMKTPGGDQK